jgi:hypothetical protein
MDALGCMCVSYSIPIAYVIYHYSDHTSVSSIIQNSQIVLVSMIAMGFFTLVYEYQHYDPVSFFCILLLLVGIYGVILVPELDPSHYFFAILAFLSILGFMINHCNTPLSYISVGAQLYVASLFYQSEIFWKEIFFIGNFAVFYLYKSICENNF